MGNKIELIMSSVQQFCREGYLLPKERRILFDLAELHGIDKTELERVLKRELEKVRASRLDNLYKIAKQPDAALSDRPGLFQQSRRQFPDMLKLGTLRLKLNPSVTAPAFVPIKDMAGMCIVHENPEAACNIIQTVVMRLLLSTPRSLANVTVVDPSSMGADYIGLSGIDSHLLKVIDDEKQVLPFLQSVSRDSASFNFNGLGNSFSDIGEYNRTNRSKAHPYHLVILSDFQNITDKGVLTEIKKIAKLAAKTGVFFLLDICIDKFISAPELLDVFKFRSDGLPGICVVNTVTKEIHAENSDEESFFNNAFEFIIDEDLLFSVETIAELNHEYDPASYTIGGGDNDRGDFCIESLNVAVGKLAGKEKLFSIPIQQSHDNILVVSTEDQFADSYFGSLLNGLLKGYKRSEISYVFYNCHFIPQDLTASNVIANIHTDKISYLTSLLKHVENEMTERRRLFAEASVKCYEAFRNVVESPLPRIIVSLGQIDQVLDSESMNAVDAVMQLDQLLDMAGTFGIHFIMLGKPSINLFKVNLAEYVRYKLLHSLNEEEAMRVGVFATGEELNHLNGQGCVLLNDAGQSASYKILYSDTEEKANAFVTTEEPMSSPSVFVDIDDTFPRVYQGLNVDVLAESCLVDSFPVGIPRTYSQEFASLGNENVIVVGDDADGELSILRSVYLALKRMGNLSRLLVYDASGGYPLGLPGMPGVSVSSDLRSSSIGDEAVVCLLNMDAFDPQAIHVLGNVFDVVQQKKGRMVVFSKTDISDTLLSVSDTAFNTRMALTGAPEGFISQVKFFSDDEIKLPGVPLQAISEQIDSLGGNEVKSMWLFKY